LSVGFVISVLVWGFVLGGLARFALPGPDPMPAWLTIAIGLTGAIAGAGLGRLITGDDTIASILSVALAIALVAAYRRFVQHRPIFGPGAMAFPKRGLGVAEQREKLRQLGFDPDNLRPPGRQNLERTRLEAMLRELHRAGVLSDDELQAKLDRLATETADT
jgi:uncharacterized membrane protein YeaQ/YmgE (transglycosylase-associated protein family)